MLPWLSLWFVGGCGPPTPVEEPVFLRDAVLLAQGGTGRAVGGGRTLIEGPWTPGPVEIGGVATTAPQVPQCVGLFSVELGDVGRWVAMGAEPPDTALAFSPDGDRLAVGTWDGTVQVLDGWTGARVARLNLSETLIKRVAWSEDGQTLYAAEQSADAWVYALDPTTLEVRARLRLADHVQSSAPPDGDDLYGVYTLPGAYALRVLDGGDLLVVATHGWNDADGVRRNRARVFRLSPSLAIQAAWPAEGAADAVILAADAVGQRIAVALSRSATTPAPTDLPIDGVQLLDREHLAPIGDVRIPPLAPWYDRSFVWEALALDPAAGVAVGLGDGRLVWWETGSELDIEPLGAPVELGDVAIAASVGQLERVGERLFALTAGTNIPYGSAHPDLRPPQAHPNENALLALRHGATGWSTEWTWRGPYRLAGIAISPDGTTLVAGAGARSSDRRSDLFGALVFDLERDRAPVPLFCPTEGPVFFRQALTADGRIAVAEHPWMDGDQVRGSYRVTVLR